MRGAQPATWPRQRRIVDICLEAGVNLFDTADVYSDGRSEEVLGKALEGRRDKVLISTKATFRLGDGPNDVGSSRYHLRESIEGSLRRLGTDYVDIYHLHGFDALTPIDEVQDTLNTFVREGKVRYIACSNFSGWHLMKSLAVADRYGWTRFVAHQVYYSLVGREYEWELMPLGLDQKSRRAGVESARLGTAHRQAAPRPAVAGSEPPAQDRPTWARRWTDEYLYKVVDALDAVAAETGKTVPQVALNWLLQRPTVSSRHRRRAQRGAVAAEPGRGGLEPDGRADRGAGQGQRGYAGLSLLASAAVWRSAIRRRCEKDREQGSGNRD